MKRVGMVGFFGWGNFGDELFLKAHRQELGDHYQLSVTHDSLTEPYHSRPIKEVVDEYDGFLVGGGDLLNPIRVSSLYWNHEYLAKPVFVYGLGVADATFEREPVLAHYASFFEHENCKLIVARDIESYRWLESRFDLGSKLGCFPDPVCAVTLPAPVEASEKTLGIVMREQPPLSPDMSALHRMTDDAKIKGYRVRHLVLATDSRGVADERRARMIARSDEEVVTSADLDDLCREISACSMLATIKFHGLVVATMYGIPAIAMSDSGKNQNFLRYIEREDLLATYTDPRLHERIPHHPARIHQLVRSHLRDESLRGYSVLRDAMAQHLGV